jgi:hypothetical protein
LDELMKFMFSREGSEVFRKARDRGAHAGFVQHHFGGRPEPVDAEGWWLRCKEFRDLAGKVPTDKQRLWSYEEALAAAEEVMRADLRHLEAMTAIPLLRQMVAYYEPRARY